MANNKANNNEQNLEKKLWAAADKLRKNMDAAEYKHVVLGLIFLKYSLPTLVFFCTIYANSTIYAGMAGII
jgi:type I restriction enzyme M protein